MKKLMLLMFAFVLTLSLGAFAQDPANSPNGKAEKQEADAAAQGKAMTVTGWVKTKAGKTVFVNDKDKQTWNVSNPDVLKEHNGHHVELKATFDTANKSISVDDVKMLRKGKQSAEVQKSGT